MMQPGGALDPSVVVVVVVDGGRVYGGVEEEGACRRCHAHAASYNDERRGVGEREARSFWLEENEEEEE
ncbi:unnamed protein product [Caenorhabditis auriculariae]|uniref:Uncharacterized protein n=1 Tax=Caenorhabditis auriculariae TaxID=2777116 RepID=A0A8S1GTV3_9PELO|nr:unnamed protein product [Caenorhabditis auriculariae]